MWLNVMQYSETKIKEVYDIVKHKYETKYKDNYSRFVHILGVEKMARYLANIYKVDESKARIAALVHDYYKYEDEEEMKLHISKEDLEECKKYPVLYHSYASANSLKETFNIDDPEIKSAIKCHVFGKKNMSRLDEIILISDYTEGNRQYENCIKCREILLDKGIEEAIYFSTLKVIEFLNKKEIVPHPLQYEVLKDYERKLKHE